MRPVARGARTLVFRSCSLLLPRVVPGRPRVALVEAATTTEPLLHDAPVLLLGLLLRVAVALLQQADQALGLALDSVEVVVRELAPLLLDEAPQLPPLALQDVLVHHGPPQDVNS